jgi:F-type H+-transporting ATPase subunit b
MIHFDEKFWLAVSFFSFFGLAAKYLWPIIGGRLDNGSKKIAEEILLAKKMKEDGEKLLAKAEEIYKDAVSFSEKLIKDTEDEVRKLASESEKLLAEEVAKRKKIAIDRIKFEEEFAIRELKAKIVNSALGKLANDLSLNKEDHEKLVEKAVNNLGKTVH